MSQPLNLDRSISYPEQEMTDCTATSSTWKPCYHLNGWYFTVHFWIFKKKLFWCNDCDRHYDAKIIKFIQKVGKGMHKSK